MAKRLYVIAFLLLVVSLGYSQESGEIRGHITDAEMQDEPLLFAHVTLADTDLSVQTNFHGNFELSDIEPGQYILTIDYLGYESLKIPVLVESDQVTYIEKSLAAKTPNHTGINISSTASAITSEK